MLLTLPPRKGSSPLEIDTEGLRHIVIIGANGSGKTRFARRLAADLGTQAFNVSALKALYGRDREDTSPVSIDSMYHSAIDGASLLRPDLTGEFERLIGLMVNEEMLSLIEYKYGGRRRGKQATT
ncbi:MAG: ATP-binding protein, partial [Duncaniella sp.]|nr:ATP-binding protein [Duncaniella sp.]